MSDSPKLPAIRQPQKNLDSLYATVLEIKQVVEILAGQRGAGNLAAVLHAQLEAKMKDQP